MTFDRNTLRILLPPKLEELLKILGLNTMQKITSTELSGGTGFTFEDQCAAFYLASLLGETGAPGLYGRSVIRVAQQQANAKEPLDDIIIDGRAGDGSEGRVSLQVKRKVVISSADTNTDFRDIITQAHKTLQKPDLGQDIDRIGFIAQYFSNQEHYRALELLGEYARACNTFADFDENSFDASRKHVYGSIKAILLSIDNTLTDLHLFNFLRHFIVLRFDFLHEGATDPIEAIEKCQRVLNPSESNRAVQLWNQLLVIARTGSGHGAQHSRLSLINKLKGEFNLSAVPSLIPAINKVHEVTNAALSDIRTDIEGFTITRLSIENNIVQAIEKNKLTLITGLPGVGKTVTLHNLIAKARVKGPCLFLKNDRIEGNSWPSYASSQGLANVLLKDLLTEIAAIGETILFIDGLDRVEGKHQKVISDVLNVMSSDPDFAVWKVVATVRDEGLEPLRTWIPQFWWQDGFSKVEVGSLDDTESLTLAQEKPNLKPLLFSKGPVRDLARRPFYLEILAKLDATGSAEPLDSEITLSEAWWVRGGGYDSPAQNNLPRQQLLMKLAKLGAHDMGRTVRLSLLLPTEYDIIQDLKRDGIIRDYKLGHSVKFSHDIFFEWALLHFFIDNGETLPQELKRLGEPPVLGRAIELLSQYFFKEPTLWKETFQGLEKSNLRSQWFRAWLLGALNASNFIHGSPIFNETLLKNDSKRLHQFLVWLQAEKTQANPGILEGNMSTDSSGDEILRLAHLIAWPSDTQLWKKALLWILDNIENIPPQTVPDVISVFEVWQNAFSNIPNGISKEIVKKCYEWLTTIEEQLHPEDYNNRVNSWAVDNSILKDTEQRLRIIVLVAGRVESEVLLSYIERLSEKERLRNSVFKDIIQFSRILAEINPKLLVDFVLLHVLDELPDERERRLEKESHWYRSSYDPLDKFSLEDQSRTFYPPSPLREPFASLFSLAPDEARRLVRTLCNHAINAWRQLHKYDSHQKATPIPLTLSFPWGEQVFWGNSQVYVWFRGIWGPSPAISGLMALENWAFDELERNRDVDSIVQDVLEGHECCSVLGIAAALYLSNQKRSETSLTLAVCQRLWHWEVKRMTDDKPGFNSNIIPFSYTGKDRYFEAVRVSNEREVRNMDFRWLSQLFILSDEDELKRQAQEKIREFPKNLPFDYEELKKNTAFVQDLLQFAEIWAEYAEPEHYRLYKTDEGTVILHEGPRRNKTDVVENMKQNQEFMTTTMLSHLAMKAFQNNCQPPELNFSTALQKAKALYEPDLFSEPVDLDDVELSMRRNAVSGSAAAILAFSETINEQDKKWAETVIEQCLTIAEPVTHPLWTSTQVASFHPNLYATKLLGKRLREGKSSLADREALLFLCAYPLRAVSSQAFSEIMACYSAYPRLAWAALYLVVEQSFYVSPFEDEPKEKKLEARFQQIQTAFETALEYVASEEPVILSLKIPPAWVEQESRQVQATDPPERKWKEPDKPFDYHFILGFMPLISVEDIMADESRSSAFLEFCEDLVEWTVQKISPPWKETSRDSYAAHLYEWNTDLYEFLAQVAIRMPPDNAKRLFLDPILTLDEDEAVTLVLSFSDFIVRSGIMDPVQPYHSAISLLDGCADWILTVKRWRRASDWIEGMSMDDANLSRIIKVFFCIQTGYASGACRFANNNWADINIILPLVNKFVRKVGYIRDVATSYISLVEKSIEHYPVQDFIKLCLYILNHPEQHFVGWHDSRLTGRIAGLVQSFAEKYQPMPQDLAQEMLQILDKLVDLGDRRSAALQNSELFREVRLIPTV